MMNAKRAIDLLEGRCMDSLPYEVEEAKAAKEIAEAFSRWVNRFGMNPDMLARAMASDHPTLIQSKMRVFLEFCKLMSERFDSGQFDMRNEATVRLSKKIMALNDDHAFLPFI